MRCSTYISLWTLFRVSIIISSASDEFSSTNKKEKRQIFREQVLPHTGGKIPEEAFRADRLALNRLNKDGIAVPDGVVLDARRVQKPHARPNADLEMAIIKVLLTPDGRLVAPEGRYHFPNPQTVDSTYVIRPPIGSYDKQWQGPEQNPLNKPIPMTTGHNQIHSLVNNENFPHFLRLAEGLADFRQTQNGAYPDYYHPFYVPQWTGFDPTIANIAATWDEKSDKNVKKPPSSSLVYNERVARRIQLSKTAIQANQIVKNFERSAIKGNGVASPSRDTFHCDLSKGQQIQINPKDKCKVFYVCQSDGRHDSFFCPKGTLFNKAISQCDWWYNVQCG